ncbi:MAG: cobaltochelatase subunit [Frankiales bacterium]|nr:cobaltochelatase subunit [Frankiales bacterium]
MSAAYPFSAVVGLEDLRLALVVNAVSPAVGGVLVRGEKGTAKSTVVRALASLLPPVETVEGCRFSCEPGDDDCPDAASHGSPLVRPARLVELPVGASEDRLVGSLDLEKALTSGVSAYEPGLLAQAHRGVLYVDEVNLLHDHLVDLLLDAAALGRSYVEREGVSVQHAARFLLVGTMNPEEGELRPQLLDRFGLTVEVAATRDPVERADVVRKRLAYEADPDAFAARYRDDDAALAARIADARALLPSVQLSDRALREVTTVCAAFDVDGLRADLVTAKAALALAAWDGRTDVTTDDVRTAARLALPHRRRRTPFEAPGLDEQQLEDALADADQGPESPDDPPPSGGGGQAQQQPTTEAAADGQTEAEPAGASASTEQQQSAAQQPSEETQDGGADAPAPGERTDDAGDPFRAVPLRVPGVNRRAGAAGRRSRTSGDTGRLTGDRAPSGRLTSLHLAATLRAAAPHQVGRGRSGPGVVLRPRDLRQAVREGREGNLVVFAVDASGSMAARSRTSAVKGAVLSLLTDAYQRRDKVALVSMRGSDAELLLPPTSSVEAAVARLRTMPTGGRTPLSSGLLRVAELLRVEQVRDPARRALVVVVTDGRHTSGPPPELAAAHLARTGAACVVVDCESGPVRLGLAATLGQQLGGVALRLEELSADSLTRVVKAVA